MASRLSLHNELKEVLGLSNVYFQPPESIKMRYPAIVYELDSILKDYANDESYSVKKRYKATLITDNPDTEIVDALVNLPYCEYDRSYISDNLYHFNFKLYY